MPTVSFPQVHQGFFGFNKPAGTYDESKSSLLRHPDLEPAEKALIESHLKSLRTQLNTIADSASRRTATGRGDTATRQRAYQDFLDKELAPLHQETLATFNFESFIDKEEERLKEQESFLDRKLEHFSRLNPSSYEEHSFIQQEIGKTKQEIAALKNTKDEFSKKNFRDPKGNPEEFLSHLEAQLSDITTKLEAAPGIPLYEEQKKQLEKQIRILKALYDATDQYFMAIQQGEGGLGEAYKQAYAYDSDTYAPVQLERGFNADHTGRITAEKFDLKNNKSGTDVLQQPSNFLKRAGIFITEESNGEFRFKAQLRIGYAISGTADAKFLLQDVLTAAKDLIEKKGCTVIDLSETRDFLYARLNPAMGISPEELNQLLVEQVVNPLFEQGYSCTVRGASYQPPANQPQNPPQTVFNSTGSSAPSSSTTTPGFGRSP